MPQDNSPRVLLVPCGPVEDKDIEFLARALSERGMRVLRTAAEEVPAAAFDERRQQYRGDLADVRQKSAVISLFRLRADADEETFHRRAVKEAVHELGHTWGLSHCPHPRCVMRFSNSLEDTDRKETEWCGSCGRKLEKAVRPLVSIKNQG